MMLDALRVKFDAFLKYYVKIVAENIPCFFVVFFFQGY